MSPHYARITKQQPIETSTMEKYISLVRHPEQYALCVIQIIVSLVSLSYLRSYSVLKRCLFNLTLSITPLGNMKANRSRLNSALVL